MDEVDTQGEKLTKYLRYFGSELQADKVLCCLCCTIIGLFIVLCVVWGLEDKN